MKLFLFRWDMGQLVFDIDMTKMEYLTTIKDVTIYVSKCNYYYDSKKEKLTYNKSIDDSVFVYGAINDQLVYLTSHKMDGLCSKLEAAYDNMLQMINNAIDTEKCKEAIDRYNESIKERDLKIKEKIMRIKKEEEDTNNKLYEITSTFAMNDDTERVMEGEDLVNIAKLVGYKLHPKYVNSLRNKIGEIKYKNGKWESCEQYGKTNVVYSLNKIMSDLYDCMIHKDTK